MRHFLVFVFVCVLPSMIAGAAEIQRGERPVWADDVIITYKAMTVMTNAERRAVFRTLSSDSKARLWKLHFDTILANRADLSPQQRVIIEESSRFLTSEVYEIDRNSQDWNDRVLPQVLRIRQRIADYFPEELSAVVFTQLGPAPVPKSPELVPIESANGLRVGADADEPCECHAENGYGDFCFVHYYCAREGQCKASSPGCGWAWVQECNGLCTRIVGT